MLVTVFKNQVIITIIIACIWLILGLLFTKLANLKYKHRKKEKRIKKVSKLYPQQ